MIQPIEDPDDPRIEGYRAVRERDLAGREGLFVLEGRVVVEKAVRACPDRLVSLLVAQNRLDGLADVLAAWPPHAPVFQAAQGVMDRIVGFPIHRGVLALGVRRPRAPADLLAALPPEALVVGLMGIANHDNVGGIFRNCAAFGVDAVLMDATSCDPLYRKAIRVSVGGVLTVPFAQMAAGEDLPNLLAAHGFETVALSPRGAQEIADLAPSRRTALLFGAEGPGLPDEVLARVRTARIDMAGDFDSLNVGTSSGIVLHSVRRGRGLPFESRD